jgi:uncharacterized protein GlcG (DUF336 family)
MAAMGAKATRQPDHSVALANVDDVGNVISAARMAQGRALPQPMAICKAYSATLLSQETLAYAERLQSQGRTVAEMGDPKLVAVQGECSPCVRRANCTMAWRRVQLDRESLRVSQVPCESLGVSQVRRRPW